MKAKVEEDGRIALPKPLRERLGLTAGTARLERRGNHLVAVSDTKVSDEDVFDVLDSIRR